MLSEDIRAIALVLAELYGDKGDDLGPDWMFAAGWATGTLLREAERLEEEGR